MMSFSINVTFKNFTYLIRTISTIANFITDKNKFRNIFIRYL